MRHHLRLIVMLIAASVCIPVPPTFAQAPRRATPSGMLLGAPGTPIVADSAWPADTILLKRRLVGGHQFAFGILPIQEPERECRSTTGYVVFGGLVGVLFGMARYENGLSDGVDYAPWISIPWVVGPYMLGGMLLGHLLAPC